MNAWIMASAWKGFCSVEPKFFQIIFDFGVSSSWITIISCIFRVKFDKRHEINEKNSGTRSCTRNEWPPWFWKKRHQFLKFHLYPNFHIWWLSWVWNVVSSFFEVRVLCIRLKIQHFFKLMKFWLATATRPKTSFLWNFHDCHHPLENEFRAWKQVPRADQFDFAEK